MSLLSLAMSYFGDFFRFWNLIAAELANTPHMKSRRNCFSGRRAAPARRKAIRTFKGRLRAFLLMLQHRRKQIRHERAFTLLACFPIKKRGNKREGGGNHERGKPKRRGRRYTSTGAAHCREWPIFAPGEFRLHLLM